MVDLSGIEPLASSLHNPASTARGVLASPVSRREEDASMTGLHFVIFRRRPACEA